VPADSPVWILLEQLAEQAEAITVAGGYRTDIGNRVSLEPEALHAEDPDSTPPPRLLIGLASTVSLGERSTQQRRRSFDVAVEVAVWADAGDAQAQAHAALEDLLDVFGQQRQYLQSATASAQLRPARAEVLTRPEGLPVVAAVLTLTAVLDEKLPAPTVMAPIGPPA
jgi:hypothetical protein